MGADVTSGITIAGVAGAGAAATGAAITGDATGSAVWARAGVETSASTAEIAMVALDERVRLLIMPM